PPSANCRDWCCWCLFCTSGHRVCSAAVNHQDTVMPASPFAPHPVPAPRHRPLSWQTALALLFFAALACIPLLATGYYLGVLTFAFYVAVYAMNWDLLFGYLGEVNFGPTF